mgnify:CR=1 FL=1
MIAMTLSAASCGQPRDRVEAPAEAETVADTLPEDFLAFYKRFHEDSAYQMDHIIFPLEGMPDSMTGEDSLGTDRYFWQRDTWKLHRRFLNPDNQFESWFHVYETNMIEHWIQTRVGGMAMMRRFAKLQGEWYLIYYRGMRPKG